MVVHSLWRSESSTEQLLLVKAEEMTERLKYLQGDVRVSSQSAELCFNQLYFVAKLNLAFKNTLAQLKAAWSVLCSL